MATPSTPALDGAPAAPGPLAGVRVLELGSFIAGPFAGQLLGDLGADVVKVERPGTGDPMRAWGVCVDGRSLWWPAIARNKRSLAVDLRDPRGRAAVARVAGRCDVVLENFRPGLVDEWGLGYRDLAVDHPRLVVTHVSGFGQTGPRAAEPGFGAIGEALGGIRHTTGHPDRPPARTGVSLGDSLAACFAVIGTLAALHERERSGRGQEVDVAIYEAVLALMESTVADWELAGVVRERHGGSLRRVAPSDAYPTADGIEVLIAANADAVFARLAVAMGRPELATDDRYATHVARAEHQDELDGIVAAWSASHPIEVVEAVLREHEVPHGRVARAPDLARDPHVAAREMILRLAAGFERPVPMTAPVPKLTRTPGTVRAVGPGLGEHTAEILRDLAGLDDAEIEALHAAGVIEVERST